jgi:hypothetical protein
LRPESIDLSKTENHTKKFDMFQIIRKRLQKIFIVCDWFSTYIERNPECPSMNLGRSFFGFCS